MSHSSAVDQFVGSQAIAKAASAHAVAEYPNESVGCVIESPDGLIYEALENVSTNPTHSFAIGVHPDEPILAIIHSHSLDVSTAPSRVDMSSQQAMAVPWGILHSTQNSAGEIHWFGDQLPAAPLLGRSFVSGHHDCWGLVRDVYRSQFDIVLQNIPRDENWYKHEPPHGEALDLLGHNRIIETGFTVIPQSAAREGDVILGKIGRTGVINHCGLLVGNGLVLHQLEGRSSRREPVGPWMRYVQFVARHNSFMDRSAPKVTIR